MLKREGERRQKVVDEAAAAENAMKTGGWFKRWGRLCSV
jgi:hypothetical protein